MTRPETGLPKGSLEKSPVRMASEGTRPVKGMSVELIFLFAIDEEKGLVLSNGSADGAAKLVQVELFAGGGEVALGIEIGIAQKFVERPVKVVGSRILW